MYYKNKWDKNLFYLGIFFLPFINLNLKNLTGIDSPGFENIVIADIIFFLLFIKVILFNARIIYKRYILFYFLIYIFILSNVLTLFKTENLLNTINGILQYTFIFIIMFFLFTYYIKNKDDISKVINIYYYSIITIILYTTLIVVTNYESVSTVHGRLFSIFANPWIMSFYLVISIPFIIYKIKSCKRPMIKFFNIIIILLVIYLIILSGARSSFVAIFITVLVYLIFKISKMHISLYLKGFYISTSCFFIGLVLFSYKQIIVIILPLINILSPITAIKLNSILDGTLDESRIEILINGFNVLSKNTLIGVGPGGFSSLNGIAMHNFLFSLLIDSGLLAFMAILLMNVYIFVNLKRIKERNIKEFVLFLNIIFHVFMMFNPLLLVRFFWFPFILSVVCIYIFSSINKEYEVYENGE